MPELPDVEIYTEHIKKTSLGRTITKVRVLNTRTVRGRPPKELSEAVVRDELVSVSRYGKNLFIKMENKGYILMHFGMTGYPKFLKEGEPQPEHTRLVFDFKGGGSLAFVDQRLFGMVSVIPDPAEYVRERGLGPDALEIDDITFAARLARIRGEIKPTLMDQKFIAGLGNIYSDEILFQAQVHPEQRADEAERDKGDLLFHAMRDALTTAIKKYDDPPTTFLITQRHIGGHCPTCGNRLALKKVGGLTSYFCPVEQVLEEVGSKAA